MSLARLRLPTRLAATLAAVLALSACGFITPYKVDVLQGNVVTREQVQALKPGMPRQQVRDILGSPLLTSMFHADRWDYVFTLRRQGQDVQRRRVAVFFKDGVLERHEADELPSETDFVATLDARRSIGKVPVLEATEAQLKDFTERNKPLNPPPPTSAASAPSTTNFPPLDSAGGGR